MQDGEGAVLVLCFVVVSFFIGTCAGSEYSYGRMCEEEVLPRVETLADSLALVQQYDECEWWEEN